MSAASLSMPYVGFGCANTSLAPDGVRSFTSQDIADAVAEVLRQGCPHVDCAALYGNQPEIGATAFATLTPARRAALWVTSKLWLTNFAAAHVRPALVDTLGALHLGYLDLYIMHAPVGLQHVGIPLPADSTPRGAAGDAVLSGVPHAETWTALGACADEVRKTPCWPRSWTNCSLL